MKKGHAETKWNFAIGTTSRVPNSQLHYLIGDIDQLDFDPMMIFQYSPEIVVIQRTDHGWHFYTDCKLTLKQCVIAQRVIGCDKAWIRIGQSRGYFFLADKSPIILPWPVERMVLRGKGKK